MREVAYEQIPRAERADKHRRAAEWIESLGRPEDHAEMLAHHYLAALEYARATGSETGRLAERARGAFHEAGDRAFALNAFPAAAHYYELAIELWPTEDASLPELLLQLARVRHVSQDERREQSLKDARKALLAAGRSELAAEAAALLAEAAWYRRDREACDRYLERAAEEVAGLPDSRSKALVLSQVSRYRMLADEFADAIRIGGEALAMAERLGLDEFRAHALNNIGTARVSLGDEGGLADLEQAAQLGLAVRSPEAARALNNLAVAYVSLGDFARQGECLAEAVRVGEELGTVAIARYARTGLASNMFWRGRWDEGLRLAEKCMAEGETPTGELIIRRNRARVLLGRDDVEGALEDVERALEGARQIGEPQSLFPALGVAAVLYVAVGREKDARKVGAELVEQLKHKAEWRLLEFSFVAGELGYGDELREQLEALPRTQLNAAILAVVEGDFGRAAEIFDAGDIAFAAADARRRWAEQLTREGRHREAEEQLELALAFYRSVRATRYEREAEALLAAAS